MAAEDESLTLRVSLDDQASAQLAALRGQLDQMRGMGSATSQVQAAAPQIVAAIGAATQQLTAMAQQLQALPTQITSAMSATVQGLAQVQNQLTQIGTQVQQASQQVAGMPGRVAAGTQGLTNAVRQAGFLGGIAGGATAELVAQLSRLGNNLVERATDFHGLADSMKDLQTNARGVGQSMTGYEGLSRQLELGGLSAKDAQKTISEFSDLSGELKQYGGAENTPTFRRLTQYTDPKTTQTIFDTMKKMEGAPIEEQINLWKELHDNILQTMTLEKRPEQFEAAWKEISQNAGLGAELDKMEPGTRLKREPPDPVREQMLRDRATETAKFTRESLQASFYWRDIGDSMAASLVHGLELTGTTGEIGGWLKRIKDDAVEFERVFRETNFETALEALKKLDPVIAPYVEQVKELAVGLKGTAETTVEEFKAILPILHEINDLLEKLGMKPPKPKAPEGTPERAAQDREEEQGAGLAGAGYLHRYLLRHGLIAPRQGEQIPPSENVEPEPEKPQTSTLSPLRRLLDYNKRMREAEQKELERTRSAAPPPPPPPQPPPPPEMSEAERAARERMRGLRIPAPGDEGEPIIVPQPEQKTPLWFEPTPQRPDVGQGKAENPDPNRFTRFPPAKAPIEDLRPPGGGPFHSKFDPPTYSEKEMSAADAASWKTPAGMAFLKRGEELLTNPPTGTTPLDRLGLTPDKYIQGRDELRAKLDNLRDWQRGESVPPAARFAGSGGWQPGQNEADDKAAGFGERFGIWPGMGADKLDQTSNKLDQAANSNVNISGAGKIQVDVRAPPGTSVDASGEGFFKSTEITRMTQMMPSDFGPLPATGIGTGQGTAANGTSSSG